MLRIIGGELKGKKLLVPKDIHISPTSALIKKSIFNMIKDQKNQIWLDIFAGTGAVGIEALSRGAIKTIFIEKNNSCYQFLYKNLKLCGFIKKSLILKMSAIQSIFFLKSKKYMFDIIFIDPPYDKNNVNFILNKIILCNILIKNGLIIIQHSSREFLKFQYNFRIINNKKYGDSEISILKKK